jgi:hypothetical protein
MLAVIYLRFGSRAMDGGKQAERTKEADSCEQMCVMKEEEEILAVARREGERRV